MKSSISLAGAFLSLLFSGLAQAQLLQFNFNGNLNNSGSLGGSLTTVNGSSGSVGLSAPGTGLLGGTTQALDLTSSTGMGQGSTGGYASFTPAANMNAASFTFVTWYKTTGNTELGNKARLFDTDSDGVSVRGGDVATQTNYGYVTLSDGTPGSPSNQTYTSNGTWTFIAVTFDATQGSGVTTFYQGTTSTAVTQVAQVSGNPFGTNAVPLLNGAFLLGNRGTSDRPFVGYLDDVALYAGATDSTGALSQTAIESIRQADLVGPQPTTYVNPFLGTNPSPTGTSGFSFDTGDVFPGATSPDGMVQFSPDTPSNIPGGYWYPDTSITSFSLTHFSGRGISYEGDFGFMPVAGAVSPTSTFSFGTYTAPFSHSNEQAVPGYYKVTLNNGNTVETTVTTHTGTMQATFPAGTTTGSLLLNFANNVRGVSNCQVSLVNGTELTGSATSTISGGEPYTVYISIVFDQPITAASLWNGANLASVPLTGTSTVGSTNTGAVISFNTTSNEMVHATAGISYVSIANAQLNRTTEYPSGSTFASVAQATSSAWNTRLSHIQITDSNASTNNLTVFYTELYHTNIHPNIFDDVNGQYIGFDNAIHTVASGHHHYTHIPGWDEYRSHSAFKAFLLPTLYSDVAQSLVDDAAQDGGTVDRWIQQNQDSHSMIGDGGSIILANAYAFGATNFDTASALTYMNANASGANGYREDENQYLSPGWAYDNASITLEYAVADMAVAQYANAMGNNTLYQKYLASAQNWRNNFNNSTLYVTSRNSSGLWDDMNTGWTEGSQGQYTWLVPFNQRGLFDAMGGNANVVPRLDAYFGWNASTQTYTALNSNAGAQTDYAGNEPDESQPWSFLYAGAPWKTQKVVRDIQTTLYTNTPNGLPGNDDAGALSSWYVMSALGIYPMVSGVGGFVIGSPAFASATITTDNGHVLQINGTNAAPGNPYVQSLQVNGAASTSLWLPVSTILNNPTTTLTFTLGSTPNTNWGTGASDVPPSFDVPGTVPTIATAPAANPSPVTGTTAALSVLGADTGANGEPGLTYTWSTVAAPSVTLPTFGSANGTNAGKNTVATFHGPGSYTFQVVISNGSRAAYGVLNVTVNQTATGLAISPSSAAILPNTTQQFTANVVDQFGNALSSQAVTWSLTSGAGSISSSGLYQATSALGSATVMAVSGGFTATAVINVANVIDVTNGLVGRWTFDEDSGTIAGNTAPDQTVGSGTLVNSPAWTAPGYIGTSCLSFNPSGLTYVAVPNSADLNITAAITLSAWIKPAGWSGNSRIIEKGGDPTGTPMGADAQYFIFGTSSNLQFSLSGVGTLLVPTPSTGTWHHVAATWDGSTMKVYIDNVLAGSQAATGTIGTSTTPLIIGDKSAVAVTAGDFFNGLIDDVRVYNRALSAAEINTVYTDATTSPYIVNTAAANPSTPGVGSGSTLSVLGGDVSGEGILTYTWQTTGTPPAPVTFSVNGTNAAKQTTPTYSAPGNYSFLVTVSDPQGRTITSSASVTVSNNLNATISSSTTVPLTTNAFTATGLTLNLSLAYTPSPGDVLLIVNNTGSNPISGTFTNLPNSGTITVVYNGVPYTFVASYTGGTGNDLTLTYQPSNPASADTPVMPVWGLVAMAGLLFFLAARRRKDPSGCLAVD